MSSLSVPSPLPLDTRRDVARDSSRSFVRDYADLFKVRVTAMVLLTVWCGAYLAAAPESAFSLNIVDALLGIALVAAGNFALNEVFERDVDGRMRRTCMRPLVTGRIATGYAAATAAIMIAGGAAYIGLTTNWLTAALTLLTSAAYLGAYTPLKKVTPLCTAIGAIPGAMPPVLGWTAVRGQIELPAIVVFLILFLWQFPHFHAIALLHREDYAKANVRMLPVVDASGNSTIRSILIFTLVLGAASFVPALTGMDGVAYSIAAFVLGSALLLASLRLWYAHTFRGFSNIKPQARRLFVATVLYLPALFAALLIGIRS